MMAIKTCLTCKTETEVPSGTLVDLRCQTFRCKGSAVTFDRKVRRQLHGEETWEKVGPGEAVPVGRGGNCLWTVRYTLIPDEQLNKAEVLEDKADALKEKAEVLEDKAEVLEDKAEALKEKADATPGKKTRKRSPK